jgi:glycosyltransferase involved in cell wall biosynthesis
MGIRIAILGTRGIPNHYGGFERLAEQLSCRLAENGYEVFVYNSHNHYYKYPRWNQVNIIHCYDPEYILGTCGQFIYDLNCILDARKKQFDILLLLGYTSISVWHHLLPGNSTVIYNMDGMEWKRAKYSAITRRFLSYAERLAVKNGEYFITDSPAIKSYFKEKYDLNSEYIAYGGEVFHNENERLLEEFKVRKKEYYLLIARIEPENNIETILDGFCMSRIDKQFLVIGNTSNKFGRYLLNKFRYDKRIQFLGAVYDLQRLHSLRIFSLLYFHGHSTGGTNPSLLEAMASRALISAHDNVFNRLILHNDAFYFKSANNIKNLIEKTNTEEQREIMITNNLSKIRDSYNWSRIANQYEQFMMQCLYTKINENNILHKTYSGQ